MSCPKYDLTGTLREFPKCCIPHNGQIMISCQTDEIKLAQAADTFIGFGSITNHIAQAPYLLKITSILDDSIKRAEVGMDI